jgi:hypothetical protein
MMRIAPLAACVALTLACGTEPLAPGKNAQPKRTATTRISIAQHTEGQLARGLSIDGDALDLVIDGRGIVRIDRDGNLLLEHKLGERGLPQYAFHDLAAEGNDQYVLLVDAEGYLWDPATESFTVHFCVEPGWEEPIVVQKNDAVAVQDSLIVAAPRFYTIDSMGTEQLMESALRTYRAGDGAPLSSVDLTSEGLELTGVALAGDEVIGVQKNELVRLSLTGEVLARETLVDIEDATGVAVDIVAKEILVLDGRDAEIRVFALE